MGTRKNAKFLTPAEQENFVKACVLMKADIVNPLALLANRYSKWDEFEAIHWMIQQAFSPLSGSVNFGHGGNGAYSFLSWHRYFLFAFEQQLQSYVPGVMLPYWDWTDPSPIMTDTFLGPNGTVSNEVRSGYFAASAPGTGGNPTTSPAWWPAGLAGWISPAAFGTGSGPLRRQLSPVSQLPTAADVQQSLAKTTYPSFQNALEGGVGLTSGHQMHNQLHGWVGGAFGQMSNPKYSPFDPIFYLHHCNIDRLWTMWQMDGHDNDYPTTGGKLSHHRNDIMYPWTGGAAGFGTTASIAASIPMPDFSAVGAKLNVDTLDFRNAFGVTYDTLAIIGIGLDRTGSMTGLTPDPMTTVAPDVTKWEAAKRGVSAFLQDCETVQSSGVTYVMAGVKTFRRLGAGNDFTPVFSGPGFGLVKNGSSFSRATFDSNIASMTPGGGTPLADALSDVQNTLVEPPYGHAPADEQRYLAMLTDGLLTSGAPMASIPDGSFTQTAVFAMGFGTGADVDYVTLASMVAKGKTLSTPQVFHGENAGTIDKFYSSAVAAAIGFTTIFDPVLELFAGEHAHVHFQATSAEDAFLITAQGMDYDDNNWTFHLEGPGGVMLYGDAGHSRAAMAGHGGGCMPDVVATRATGRLSLVVQRNNADATCWVGNWTLMVAYKARLLDAMLMPTIAELLFPVAAGPARGARFSRLLVAPKERIATRNVFTKPAHRLDVQSLSTNNSDKEACNAVVNIYARTRLRLSLVPSTTLVALGDAIKVQISSDVLAGTAAFSRSFARLVAPAQDSAALVARVKRADIPNEARLKGADRMTFDSARVLAKLERANPKQVWISDQELPVVSHEGGMLHMHVEKTETAGVYHLGVYVEGAYYPHATSSQAQPGHDHAHGATLAGGVSAPGPGGAESFTRLLNISVPIVSKKKLLAATKPLATKKTRAVKKRRAARKK